MKPYQRPLFIVDGIDRFLCPLPLKLNTYRGCTGKCTYCYMSVLSDKWSTRGHTNGIAPSDLTYTEKKITSAYKGIDGFEQELIRRTVPICIGTQSDPLQPAERTYKSTLKHLQLLNEYNYPNIIITKFPTQLTHTEYLETLSNSIVQCSITGMDVLEPNIPSTQERLGAIQTLIDNGIVCQVRLWPYLPSLVDTQQILEQIAESGIKDVLFNFIKICPQKRWISTVEQYLGYNYYDYLTDNNYPLTYINGYYRPPTWKQKETLKEIESTAERYSLDIYSAIDTCTGCCCGIDQYKGFDNIGSWSIHTNGHRITENGCTFDEFIEGHNCPWETEYHQWWDQGKLIDTLSNLHFNPSTHTYVRA